MAPKVLEYGPQPEELAHRISQIDLSNARRRSGTVNSANGLPVDPRYTREYLISLNPSTPTDHTVPPPTPNVLPHSPPADDDEPLPNIAIMLAPPQPAANPFDSDDDDQPDDASNGNASPDKAISNKTAAESVLARLAGRELPVSTKKLKRGGGGKGKNKKQPPTGFEGLLFPRASQDV